MGLSDAPTPEQWAQVEKVAKDLTARYSLEEGCRFHPSQIHQIRVGLFNGHVDLQVLKAETCCCNDVVERLLKIRNDEWVRLNPTRLSTEPTSD